MTEAPKGSVEIPRKEEESDTAKKASVKELKDKLDRAEAKQELGAPTMTPKAQLLDATALEEKNPDKYYRYGTMSNPDKLEMRQHEGFTRVDKKEADDAGVREEVGKMVLIEQPRKLHEARIERQTKENKRRMESHKRDAQQTAEAIVRELRDKHGIDVPVERFFVDD